MRAGERAALTGPRSGESWTPVPPRPDAAIRAVLRKAEGGGGGGRSARAEAEAEGGTLPVVSDSLTEAEQSELMTRRAALRGWRGLTGVGAGKVGGNG